ncbi:MAG TPA: hypothetical protein VJQ54_11450 [Candidatus Sulfotelmatobacter sp.]|nr:hypothetical protein [Candidatus Sulfotelmatobacter sp.]
MFKKPVRGLFVVAVVLSLWASSLAQGQAKPGRVEGRIVRSDKDKSILTVHERKVDADRTVSYDADTKWTSQYHADKKVNPIDASQVKDGDQVICLGTYDDKGIFHAATISKRLSHSPH